MPIHQCKEKQEKGCLATLYGGLTWEQALTDGNSALSQDQELAEVAKNATPEEVAACPFLRSKQNASSATTAAQAAGPAAASTSAGAADTPVAKASGGTCPVPFHRELSSPTLWLGLTALAIGMTIGLALRGVARSS